VRLKIQTKIAYACIRENEKRNIYIALSILGISMLLGWLFGRNAWRPVENLKDRADRDQLTKLYNRHYLFNEGEKLLDECKKNGQPACLAITDIDHFKKINDTYGHDIGDEIIKAFAKRKKIMIILRNLLSVLMSLYITPRKAVEIRLFLLTPAYLFS